MVSREQVLAEVHTQLQHQIVRHETYAGELTLVVRSADIFGVLLTLRDAFGFDYLVEITCVDRFSDEERFELNYNVFNLKQNRRLRVKTRVEEASPELDSVVEVWQSANWHEREAWDMMGIRFRNHPDLRRIYLPEDFQYFPLRKEFPLVGIPGTLPLPDTTG